MGRKSGGKMKKYNRIIVELAVLLLVVLLVAPDVSSQTTVVIRLTHLWKQLGANLYNNNPGNVGIGTSTPSERLDVFGNVHISGADKGLIFPDGSAQKSAELGGGGGVPSGYSIIGETSLSPEGYSVRGLLSLGTDLWTNVNGLGTERGYTSGAVATCKHQIGNEIPKFIDCVYIVGGSQNSTIVSDVRAYDFTYKDFHVIAPMSQARNNLTAETVNGKIYAIGGSSTMFGNALNLVEEYDPSVNSWSMKAAMPTARYSLSSAVVNGKIYVFGGSVANSVGTCVVEMYDPANNTWVTKAPLPTARWAMAVGAVNGKIYAISGTVVEGTQDARVEEYDIATNSWSTKTSIPTPRRGARAGVVYNRIYVIGGYREAGGVVNTVEEYDPATDTWTSKPNMPTARQFPALAVLGDSIHVIGGAFNSIDTDEYHVYEPRVQYFLHKKN